MKAKRKSVAIYLYELAKKAPPENQRKVEEAIRVLQEERNITPEKLLRRVTI